MPMSRFFSSSYFFPGKLWFQLPKGFFLFLELCWLFRWCLAKPNLMFLSVTSAPYCNSSVFPFMIHVVIGDFGTGTTFRTFGAAVQFIPFYDCRLLIFPLLMFFSVIIYCLVFFVGFFFFSLNGLIHWQLYVFWNHIESSNQPPTNWDLIFRINWRYLLNSLWKISGNKLIWPLNCLSETLSLRLSSGDFIPKCIY